jgi:Coenzyme PQQ synthesis protein D (PqqD)
MSAAALGRDLRPAPDVHVRRFGEELVILDLARGEYFSLDPLGARVWSELAAGVSLAILVDRLAPEYEVEVDRFRADVVELVEHLVSRGLLVAVSPLNP